MPKTYQCYVPTHDIERFNEILGAEILSPSRFYILYDILVEVELTDEQVVMLRLAISDIHITPAPQLKFKWK